MARLSEKLLHLPSSLEFPIRRLTLFQLRVILFPTQQTRLHPPKPPDPPDPPDLAPSRIQLPTFVLRYPPLATDSNISAPPPPSLKSRDLLSIAYWLSSLVIFAVDKLVRCRHAAGSDPFSVHHRRSLPPLLWLRLLFLGSCALSSASMSCSSAESAPVTISCNLRQSKHPVTLLTGGSLVIVQIEARPLTSLPSFREQVFSGVTPDLKQRSSMVQTISASYMFINTGQTQDFLNNWSPSSNLNVFIRFYQTMKGLTQTCSYGKAFQNSSSAWERSLPHSSFFKERTLQSLFPLWIRLYSSSSLNRERTSCLFSRDLLLWFAIPRNQFNPFTILLLCVVVHGLVLVAISGGKDWFLKSQYMLTTPLDSDSIVSLLPTHLSRASFLLSFSIEILSVVVSFFLSHCCNQRGWKILSTYCTFKD